jgi:hypothetical protein
MRGCGPLDGGRLCREAESVISVDMAMPFSVKRRVGRPASASGGCAADVVPCGGVFACSLPVAIDTL